MRLATRGQRDMDTGPERIIDARELATVRARATRVVLRSSIATLLVGALLWVLS